ASAAENSSTLSWPMSAIQSSPSAGYGATPAIVAAAAHRSANRAAQASACGPPPDQPRATNPSAWRASRMPLTSPAASATERPGIGVELAYPGREEVTSLSPAFDTGS